MKRNLYFIYHDSEFVRYFDAELQKEKICSVANEHPLTAEPSLSVDTFYIRPACRHINLSLFCAVLQFLKNNQKVKGKKMSSMPSSLFDFLLSVERLFFPHTHARTDPG